MPKKERERLTITLGKDILRHVDDVIDGVKVRNRSHAIEYLIEKTMKPRITKAVVLAGGKGIKMRPFTYEIPKPMLPVHGRPILEYIVDNLRDHDIRDIIIVTGFLGEKIKNHFGDGNRFGVHLAYIDEGKYSGTGRPLLEAQPHLREPFVLFYGDVLIDIDLTDMMECHLARGATVTMALTSVDDPSEYGAVRLRGDRIVEFSEKPKKTPQTSRLVNAGVYCVQPDIFPLIPKKTHTMLEIDVFPQLIAAGKLSGYFFEGQWFDISTPVIFERAVKEWRNN